VLKEYYLESPIEKIWKQTLNFCGIELSEFKIFGSFDTKNRDEEGTLKEIEKFANAKTN